MKPKIESAYLCVENMDRAINFYQWFLNRSATRVSKSLYLFDIDDFRLFLFDHKKENEAVVYGDNCLLSFEINDTNKTKNEIIEQGLEIVFPLKKILNNLVFEFKDTEGNHIEVFSKIEH